MKFTSRAVIKIALVLPLWRVQDDDHLATRDGRDGSVYLGELAHLVIIGARPRHATIPFVCFDQKRGPACAALIASVLRTREGPPCTSSDLSTLPATAQLLEPGDFSAFKLRLRVASEIWIQPEELLRLAGSRAEDPDWHRQMDGMISYARSRGWVRQDGAILAHVEHLD